MVRGTLTLGFTFGCASDGGGTSDFARGNVALMTERLNRLLERLQAYPWWQVLLEIAVIWMVVYVVIRFVQGTRAAGALKVTLLLLVATTLVVRILGHQEALQRLKFLYDHFLTLLAVTLIVVFQPELRRGLIRLGEAPLRRRSHAGSGAMADAVADACMYLSRNKFGALMVVEREVGLRSQTESGTTLNARLSSRLLKTIFYPGSALHDLAVILRQSSTGAGGGEVVAAGVQLPLAEPEEMPDPSLGSRHRAAVGVTKDSDAIVIVVSEESGTISIAERGRLEAVYEPLKLREVLRARLSRSVAMVDAPVFSAEPPIGEHAGAGVGHPAEDSAAGLTIQGVRPRL